MTGWRQIRLGEISQIYSGFAFRSQDLVEHGIPVLKIGNIQNKRVIPECSDHLPEELCTEKMDRFFLHPNDTLIAMTGAGSVGKVGKMPRTDGRFLVNQRVAIVRPDAARCEPAFVYFALSQDYYETKLYGLGLGAGQPNVSGKQIGELELPFPPLPVQRRIAGILSAYDELMENSQRRIRILEAMARALYREWFVHFRFPGHEKLPRVASPLGDIPKCWEVKKLFELTKVNYGKNLPTKNLADDGPYPVYGAAKIIGRYTEYTRERRTIICGCRGSVGEMQITLPQCFVTNNSFTFDPAHPDTFFWLFHTLKERGLRDVVGGAAQPQITLEGISSVELATPPLPLLTRYHLAVSEMFEQAWTLDDQLQNLRRTRDLLLPRLLSGQVELKTEAA